MAGNNKIVDGILTDVKALPKKLLKPYFKNGKLNANKVAIDAIPFFILFYFVNKYLQAVIASSKTEVLDKCVDAFSLILQVPPYVAPSLSSCT